MRNKELKICSEYVVERTMGGYLSRGTQEIKPLAEEATKIADTKPVEQEMSNEKKPKVEEVKSSEGDGKSPEVVPPTPNSTPILGGEKEKTLDPVFKEVIQESGTKIEVRPVDVSPSADVVKKGKRKNKNKD